MLDLAAYDDVPEAGMLRVDIEENRLCLIKIDGDIYAIDDRCSHADYSLSQGTLDVEMKEVECYKHGAIFDITTGRPQCLPATKPVGTYNVIVENGRILLENNS